MFFSCLFVLANHGQLTGSFLQGWRPATTVKQSLVVIWDMLNHPSPADTAQTNGYQLFIQVFFPISITSQFLVYLRIQLLFLKKQKLSIQRVYGIFRILLSTREGCHSKAKQQCPFVQNLCKQYWVPKTGIKIDWIGFGQKPIDTSFGFNSKT